MNMRLGRAPHDPARISSVKPHVVGATAIPRTPFTWTPSLVKNDTLPTCTIAGLVNSARIWALLHGFDLTNVEANMLADFASIAGCPNTTAAISAVPGLVMLDVLEYAEKFGFDIGEPAPLVPDYSTIHLPDMVSIIDAIATKGSVYVGITLYEADMEPGAIFQGNTTNAGAAVGGHCLVPYRSASGTFDIATWGYVIQASEEWLMSRLEEAYPLTWTFTISN